MYYKNHHIRSASLFQKNQLKKKIDKSDPRSDPLKATEIKKHCFESLPQNMLVFRCLDFPKLVRKRPQHGRAWLNFWASFSVLFSTVAPMPEKFLLFKHIFTWIFLNICFCIWWVKMLAQFSQMVGPSLWGCGDDPPQASSIIFSTNQLYFC